MLHTQKSLRSYLIRSLSSNPFTEASSIWKKVKDIHGQAYSIQGVYKELRKLQDEGIVVKLGRKYSLSLSWVFDFVALADRLTETYVERPQLPLILSERNKKEIWHFSSLLKMNDFWSHLLLLLLKQSPSKVLLGWNPHPWFHLVQTEKEEQYIKALRLAKSKLYLIIGGKTFLDQWTERFWDKGVVEHSFGRSEFQEERSVYINVIDDYVVTVKLDPKASHAIDEIYERTKTMNDLNPSSVLSIFYEKRDATIWLEKNPEKAKRLKTKFKKFWGVDF